MQHILRCQSCGAFTMNEQCKCGSAAITVRPQKYSPEDKYAAYRRQVKEAVWKKQGLL